MQLVYLFTYMKLIKINVYKSNLATYIIDGWYLEFTVSWNFIIVICESQTSSKEGWPAGELNVEEGLFNPPKRDMFFSLNPAKVTIGVTMKPWHK